MIDGLAKAMSGLDAAQLATFISTNKLNVAQASLALKAAGVSREQRIQILTNTGLIASNGTLTVSLKSVTAALFAQAKAWAATPMGMATIAATSIFAIVKAVDYFSSSSERAAEKLSNLITEFDELRGEITDTANSFKTLKSSADSIVPRLSELSNGVDKFGNNISLTDEEYEEFISLNNQIAEMFPELNMGMDSNGNAMLALSYSADTLTESLYNLIEAERQASYSAIAEKMPEVLKNIKDTNNVYQDEINKLSEEWSEWGEVYQNIINQTLPTDVGTFSTVEAGLEAAEEFIEKAESLGMHGAALYEPRGNNNGYTFTIDWDYSEIFSDFDKFQSLYDGKMNGLFKKMEDYEARIKAKWDSINPVVSSWLQTDFMFNDMDSTMQQIASTMVSGLDFSSLGIKTQEDITDYITQNILEPLFLAAPEVKDAFASITDWRKQLTDGEITLEQFSGNITEAFDSLSAGMSSEEFESFSEIFVTAFNKMGIEGNNFTQVVTSLIAEWGKLPEEIGFTGNVFSDIADDIENTKNRIDSLSNALESLRDGKLEVWDVVELLKQFPELAEYVDLTADGFGNLESGLIKLIRNTPDDFISTLQEFKETNNLTDEAAEHIDELCESVANLASESVQDLSGEFGILAEQINGAKKAQNELEEALAEDDWDAGYDGRVQAFEGLQESFDAGEFGSKAYAAYKEYFGLIEKTPEQVKEWMDANRKYFSENTDGVLAFLETVEKLSGPGGALEGIASFDSETGAFWYDINALSSFADELGWTEEMLQDFISKYRMYCDEWESRSPTDSMKELENAGLITSIGNLDKVLNVDTGNYLDLRPTIASLSELMEYTGLSEDSVYDLVDSMNELRAQQGLPNIQLIGRDITSVTQSIINGWQNAGATAEEMSALIIDLAKQGVKIQPNLYIDTSDGPQIDVDTLLAEAGIEDSETVHVEVDFKVDGEAAMATVEATVAEVKEILGEDWEAKLSVDSENAETRLAAVKTLLAELPATTDVMLLDDTGLARSNLKTVTDLLNQISDNRQQTITIRYKTIGVPMYAKGTKHAKTGPALLGDEYSPNGTPKPELVVSEERAYVAGQNGPEISFLNEGDVVYTADETRKILRGNLLYKSIPAHAGGTGSGLYGNGSLGGGKYGYSGTSGQSSSSDDDSESWFERQYKDHQHWLAMDQESVDEYLKWLDKAYQKAYDEGIIDLDEYYKYQEEVYKGIQDQFKDHINDIDHEISILEAGVGSSDEIINLYMQAMQDIEKELDAARDAGLDENGDYIQWLEQQWMNYSESVTDLREQAETEAQSSIDDLVEYRIEMLKQEIQDQKDALSERLDDLQDFYDKQRKMLQDQYDEEKYLEEQKEKRKSVTDIRSELAMLENDDSAWAQKRKLELQAELSDAEKELNSFEKDHALDMTLDMLDEQQAAQEAQIQAQMDALDEKLNDPHALFNQALEDIKNNTAELYQQFIEYNRKHGLIAMARTQSDLCDRNYTYMLEPPKALYQNDRMKYA